MALQFSEGYSGTPMWQLKKKQEEQQKKDLEEKKKQAGDLLAIEPEGDRYRSVLIVSEMSAEGAFQDAKVRGPQRRSRAEAVKDGLELRAACRQAPRAEREERVRKRRRELASTAWMQHEVPGENTNVAEAQEEPMRQRLAAKPRGTGWQRVGDKNFFRHTHASMSYDPSKGRYLLMDDASQAYRECDPPHEPTEHPMLVNASASLVGRTDEDLSSQLRPRTLLLKELVKTGAAMKHPLFFLDQPASCFAMFDGVRGGAASEWCAKHFHTKLLPKLSASIRYWSDALLKELFASIFEELEVELLQQPGKCWEGVSVGVALLLGNRLVTGNLGAVHSLLLLPDGTRKVLGGEHHVGCAAERQRIEAAVGEIVPTATAGTCDEGGLVRRPVRPRQWEASETRSTEEEVARILEGSSDSFATLCFGPEDAADGKAARTSYKKLALKVHPDKVPEELKSRAKAAFEKIESAAAAVETLCDTNEAAAATVHGVLRAAGDSTTTMAPERARAILGVAETATVHEASAAAKELKEEMVKLGILSDGSLPHKDQARACHVVDEALEALAFPPPKEGEATLEAVKPTRALGLRDLKLPRQIVVAQPQVDIVDLEREGVYHIVILSGGAAMLTDEEIFTRIGSFAKQPKAGSLLVAADAAARAKKLSVEGPNRIASCIVGVFELEADDVAPSAKRARIQKGEKVRAKQILLKHKELKTKMDPKAHLRQKGPVTRPLAQAERELMRLKEAITADPSQFHILARKHSECTSCLQPGQMAGDMGWISRGSLGDQALEDVVFGLELNEISDLVSTSRGVHIVQRCA
eukprot:gnl/TRDRNA2_/TRDRNA2_132802_c2_seq1.p1 gnl/TRDRNA2_/TRDRNA2_132802_c2~~gnl/TRDRNA2_/TRDRNA2_132802_c2_seq1.p1  ORF type:complete len:812 (-),score=194.69 gnl/TRDRNA2_/TRDRNA2_132802_c2_seq1:108-2543(-)